MTFSELLKSIAVKKMYGSKDIEIKGIAYDSRKVREGYVFVCIKGYKTDGHNYVKNALDSGACAIIAEDEVSADAASVAIVENTREVLAVISSTFYGNPKDKLKIIGVTGTNGKTTVTTLIKSVLDFAGKKTGLIGTNLNMIGDEILETERTTPESLELHELFLEMVKKDMEYVIMEVSSHSLELSRVYGITFEIGIFTNLTQDHLDFHVTMENYLNAKLKMFNNSKLAVINIDDESGEYIYNYCGDRAISYSIENKSDYKGRDIKISPRGVIFEVLSQNGKYKLRLGIPGKFSVYNALAVFATCVNLGIGAQMALDALLVAKGVKGRAETVYTLTDYTVIIDYAHTPDGLENIINTVSSFAIGRVITLFGCGGDRDATKRSIMGEIAGKLSDFCIITSDNPRTENPMDIINEIEKGMKKTDCEYVVIENRREAIYYAMSMAKADDCIILAGKGHETYQIIGTEKRHFDEREVVKNFLEKHD